MKWTDGSLRLLSHFMNVFLSFSPLKNSFMFVLVFAYLRGKCDVRTSQVYLSQDTPPAGLSISNQLLPF